MKTLPTAEFSKHFNEVMHEECIVTMNGKIVGKWAPFVEPPPEVNFYERVKEDFKEPLPFTGAELLKAGKKR